MSPSAHLRGSGHSILYTLNYLAHLEQLGVRVVNGLSAFRIETSKAMQLSLYDINALSNFVADAPRVAGLDPFALLADLPPRGGAMMGFEYWSRVFGGWLRNVDDERMPPWRRQVRSGS